MEHGFKNYSYIPLAINVDNPKMIDGKVHVYLEYTGEFEYTGKMAVKMTVQRKDAKSKLTDVTVYENINIGPDALGPMSMTVPLVLPYHVHTF